MRRAAKAILVAATIIAPAGQVLSATVTVHEPDGEGRVFVDVVGRINEGDFKTFQQKTDQIYPIGPGHPNKQVIVTLMSYGGEANPALQIGDRIRKRGMSTFVPGDRMCTSACALIWLAGVPRNVGDTPQIGFHAVYDPTTRRETGAGNAVVGAYLRDLGVGYKAIIFMTRKGPASVEWLTPDVAKELGVAWTMLQPPRADPIPAQPKLQTRVHWAPPPEVIAAWSKSARTMAQQQLPTATASSSPKSVITLPMRPVIPVPGPMPQQTFTPQTQQPRAAVPNETHTPLEPGTQQAPATSAPALSAQPAAPSVSADDRHPADTYEVTKPDPSHESAAKVEEPPLASRPKIIDRIEPGQQAPATSAPGAQPPVTVPQKVVLYEEDPADPNGKRFVGSAIWRTEIVTAGPGQPPELAIRADVDIPERRLGMTWSLQRNTDKSLPASHTIEIRFKLPADFSSGGISGVPGILVKQAESTRGVPLAGLAVKVTNGFYLIGLSNQDADRGRNLQLLNERGWFDIPVVYNNNRRAILALEKGTPGDRAFAEAFKAWNQ